jgi:hypothetical protein
MSTGPLSAVNLIAGAGLLQNTGLDVNPALITNLNGYSSRPVISSFISVVNAAIALNSTFTPTPPEPPEETPEAVPIYDEFGNIVGYLPAEEPEPVEVVLPFTSETLTQIQQLGYDTQPGITNVIPEKYFASYVPPAWNEETPYRAGAQVTYYGQIWIATIDNLEVPPIDVLATYREEDPAPEATTPNWVVLQTNLLMSTSILSMARRIMGYDVTNPASGPDVSKFAQVLALSKGFSGSVNQFVGSINNSTSSASTFTNMDTISTGGISQISNNIQLYAVDSQRMGQVVNLEQLNLLGFPAGLLYNIYQAGGLVPEAQVTMLTAGVSLDDLAAAAENPVGVASEINRRMYVGMTGIRGDALQQVMQLLDVTLPGITSLADLLNPVKLLPNSYDTLTTTNLLGKPVAVYSGAAPSAALAPILATDPLLPALALIIPPDQAAANRAWARALGQIKNVSGLNMPSLAAAASFVEPLANLPLIAGLTSLIPDSVKTAIKNTLTPSAVTPTATGDGGTMTTLDLVGTAAGVPHNESLEKINPILTTMGNNNAFEDLLGAYTVMQQVVAGVYGPVDVGPIEGLPEPFNAGEPFSNADSCFKLSLLPKTETIISAIAYPNAQDKTTVGTSYDAMGAQIARESINQRGAEINFANLEPNNKNATMGLVTSLQDLGSDIAGGTATFFEKVAGATSQTGQGILASLREGRNIKVLQNIGVGIDTNLPTK